MRNSLTWPERAVGSVMALEIDQNCAAEDSVWRRWTEGRSWRSFRTARGALAALLRARNAERVLLPSYICESVAEGVSAAGCAIEYFPVGSDLCVDTGALESMIRTGDAILAIDYFGRPPDEAFLDLTRKRRDTLWIEDRAQALDTGAPAWGDVILYSPRKLFGVADGGVLVSDGALPDPVDTPPLANLWLANIARLDDPSGARAQSWFAVSQAREAGFDATPAPMSALTRILLGRTSAREHAEARRRNYAILARYLRDFALFADQTDVAFAPLAFPVLAVDAESAAATLAQQRIFCARHWPRLPSPPELFPDAHALARQCLSIPCDPRYGAEEMHRVGAAVRAILTAPILEERKPMNAFSTLPDDAPLRLRAFRPEDLPIAYAWHQDEETVRWLGNTFRFRGEAEAIEHTKRWLKSNDKEVRVAIEQRADCKLIGMVSLTEIDTFHGSANFHLMLGDTAARGRGYGEIATRLMLKHAFQDLGLKRVGLEVLTDNAPAQALYLKAGFKREGEKRGAVFKDGARHGLIIMGILAEEFAAG